MIRTHERSLRNNRSLRYWKLLCKVKGGRRARRIQERSQRYHGDAEKMQLLRGSPSICIEACILLPRLKISQETAKTTEIESSSSSHVGSVES